MKLSELAQQSGVPLPSIKYYLREGLLEPGLRLSARSSSYDEAHVKRLRLIRILTDTVGLSIARTKEVLSAIDHPGDDTFSALGRGLAALSPEPHLDHEPDGGAAPPLIRALRARHGSDDPNVAQLAQALDSAVQAGIPMSEAKLGSYRGLVAELARIDLEDMPADSAEAVEYAVVGTAIYGRVISALWRLAHQELAEEILQPDRSATEGR